MTVGEDDAAATLAIDVTPTFVVSTALATRDFQDVHHDRDRAVARGSKDIFLNILTTTGLVQRYVTDWAGPAATGRRASTSGSACPCYAYDTLTLTGRVVAARGRRGARSRWSAGSASATTSPARSGCGPVAGDAREAAAIAGIGATEFSKDSGRSELQLAAEAVRAALDDAGLAPSDVDGLVTFTMDANAEVAVARELGVAAS